MSVIGYDGKIRPKSVAVNYKPQGTMSPEQMERIHNARPDYVSGVMKMFDSINTNMTDTIGYFDKARKEREELEDKKEMLDADNKLVETYNRIDSDKNLTARDKLVEHGRSKPAFNENASVRDRRKSLHLLSTWSGLNSRLLAGVAREQEEIESAENAEQYAAFKKSVDDTMALDLPTSDKVTALLPLARAILPEGEGSASQRMLSTRMRMYFEGAQNQLVREEVASKRLLEATNLEVASKDANYAADAEYAKVAPIWLADENRDPNKIPDDLRTVFNSTEKAKKFLNMCKTPEQRAKYEADCNAWVFANSQKALAASTNANIAKSRENVNMLIANESAKAATAKNAVSGFYESFRIADSHPEVAPDEFSKVELGIFGGLNSLTLQVESAGRELESISNWAASTEAATMALRDPAAFEEKIAADEFAIRKRIEDEEKSIIEQRDGLIEAIDIDPLLNPVENAPDDIKATAASRKTMLKKSITDSANALVDSLRKAKTVRVESSRTKAKATQTAVNAERFKNLQSVLQNKDVELYPSNVGFFQILQLGESSADSMALAKRKDEEIYNESGVSSDEVLKAYCLQKYGGLPEEYKRERVFYDIKVALAGLDLSTPGDDNLRSIELLLDAAGRMLGYSSGEFRELVAFVRKNIIKEKNGKNIREIVNTTFWPGKTEQEIKDARKNLTLGQTRLLDQYENYLSECPYTGDAFYKEVDRLAKLFENTKAVETILSPDTLTEGLISAQGRAKSEKEVANKKVYNTTRRQIAKDEGDRIGNEAEIKALDNGQTAESARLEGVKAKEAYYKGRMDKEYGGFGLFDGFFGVFSSAEDAYFGRLDEEAESGNNERLDDEKGATQAERIKAMEEKVAALGPAAVKDYEEGSPVYQVGPLGAINEQHIRADELTDSGKLVRLKDVVEKHEKIKARKKELEKQNKEIEKAQAMRETKARIDWLSKGELSTKDHGYRTDGTKKGDGWFGEIDLGDGNYMTEVSVTIEVNGVSVDIPLLNPLITYDELELIKRMEKSGTKDFSEEDKKMMEGIYKKAEEWALFRLKNMRSPFIMEGEKFIPLPKQIEKLQLPKLIDLPEQENKDGEKK